MSLRLHHRTKERLSYPRFMTAWVYSAVLFLTACTGGGGGSSPPNKAGIPQTPAHLNAVPGNEQVTLTWEPVPEATGYTLYWNTTPDIDKQTANVVPNVSPGYQHQQLTNGQSYYYRVAAANGSGESLPSDEI
ncbi:fibronectin type III domain-containing protein, partial [Kaarinaea lacus]